MPATGADNYEWVKTKCSDHALTLTRSAMHYHEGSLGGPLSGSYFYFLNGRGTIASTKVTGTHLYETWYENLYVSYYQYWLVFLCSGEPRYRDRCVRRSKTVQSRNDFDSWYTLSAKEKRKFKPVPEDLNLLNRLPRGEDEWYKSLYKQVRLLPPGDFSRATYSEGASQLLSNREIILIACLVASLLAMTIMYFRRAKFQVALGVIQFKLFYRIIVTSTLPPHSKKKLIRYFGNPFGRFCGATSSDDDERDIENARDMEHLQTEQEGYDWQVEEQNRRRQGFP